MKILVITNFEAPYRMKFFEQLNYTHEIYVVFSDRKEQHSDRDKKWFKTEKHNFSYKYLKQIGSRKHHICFDVKKYINLKKWDIILIDIYSTPTAILAILYMRAKNIPFILSADGGFIKDGLGFKEKLKRMLITSASLYISSGKATTNYLRFYGAPEDRILYSPFTSISNKDILKKILTEEEKTEIKCKNSIKEKNIILAVGQYIPRKGFDILLKAASNLNIDDLGIYIIGGKPTENYLFLRSKCSECKIYFVDFKAKDELVDYFKMADVFVLPTREDIWGLVINEAMAYGLPIITTEKCIAGMELVVNGENGFIIPIEDYIELSNKINKLFSNKELKKNISKNNLKKIKNYTIEEMTKKHNEIFHVYKKESKL